MAIGSEENPETRRGDDPTRLLGRSCGSAAGTGGSAPRTGGSAAGIGGSAAGIGGARGASLHVRGGATVHIRWDLPAAAADHFRQTMRSGFPDPAIPLAPFSIS
jgi:hypothetical protein